MPIKVFDDIKCKEISPFTNLLDMAEKCKEAFNSKNETYIKKLTLDVGDIPSDMVTFYCKIVNQGGIPSSIDPDMDDDWLKYDKNKMSQIIQDSFFDEYRTTPLEKEYRRAYPLLEAFCIAKIHAYAASKFPESNLRDMQLIWCSFYGFFSEVYDYGWYGIISEIYGAFGYRWFCYNKDISPIEYVFACKAIDACLKTNRFNSLVLKEDLKNIYKEMLINLATHQKLDSNAWLIKEVEDIKRNIEEYQVDILNKKILSLENERIKLSNENLDLNKGLVELRKQINEKILKNNKIDTIDDITSLINALSPQNEKNNENLKILNAIWNKLDTTTRKDIKVSFQMFEKFESYDLALFPMIRSLEHEFARNYFEPFHISSSYKTISNLICYNRRYEKEHDSLIKKGTQYPTLGNIPFIGKAIKDSNAKESSEIINEFSKFLDNEKDSFFSICKKLEDYKTSVKKYRLVDLRNGIAHGDNSILKNIDEKCYREVSKMLYEPPIQILFEIINHSKLKLLQ